MRHYKYTDSTEKGSIKFNSVKIPLTLFHEGPLGIKSSPPGLNAEGAKGIRYNGESIVQVVPFVNAIDIDWNDADLVTMDPLFIDNEYAPKGAETIATLRTSGELIRLLKGCYLFSGGEYTAGKNLVLNGKEFSHDTPKGATYGLIGSRQGPFLVSITTDSLGHVTGGVTITLEELKNLLGLSNTLLTYYWYAGQARPLSSDLIPDNISDTEFTNNKWHTIGYTPTPIGHLITGGVNNKTWYVAVPKDLYRPTADDLKTENSSWEIDSTIQIAGHDYTVYNTFNYLDRCATYLKVLNQ